MNLQQTIEVFDLYFGGPGSGCNPEVGKCGRPKGSGDGGRESRGNPKMTTTEARSPEFRNMYTTLKSRQDLSSWEKENLVVLTRGYMNAAMVSAKGDSISTHAGDVNGFTPERAQLHDDIVGHYMSKFTEPRERPRALITGGLPGAGKTSGLKTIGTEGFVQINADDLKALFPEYGSGEGAAFLHEESSYLARVIQQKAMASRQDIVLDVTLKSVGDPTKGVNDNAMGNVKAFSKAGYDIHLQFTDVTINKSIERVMNRYIKSGRFVPPDYIRLAHSRKGTNSQNRDTFDKIRTMSEITGWSLFTTENDKLEELEKGGKSFG